MLADRALHTALAGIQRARLRLYSLTADLLCAATQRDRVADLLFDSKSGLGIEIIRYNIGGSDTDATAVNSLRPSAAVPSLLLPDGAYDWSLVSISVGHTTKTASKLVQVASVRHSAVHVAKPSCRHRQVCPFVYSRQDGTCPRAHACM